MEQWRRLEISNISSKNLKKVKRIGGMKVYGVVSISGNPIPDHNTSHNTPLDVDTVLGFNLHNPSLEANRLFLSFKFYCKRNFHDDCDVGSANVPIHKLLHLSPPTDDTAATSLPLDSSGKDSEGTVKFSYEFFPLLDFPPPVSAEPKPKPLLKSGTAHWVEVFVVQLATTAGPAVAELATTAGAAVAELATEASAAAGAAVAELATGASVAAGAAVVAILL